MGDNTMKSFLTVALITISASAAYAHVEEMDQFDSINNTPCGLNGSVDERIHDCSLQPNSQKEGFVLVARTTDSKEVYKELSTGLLWSDTLPTLMDKTNAKNACKDSIAEGAGLSGVSWKLPSINQFKEAEKSGIRKALPNMNSWFWSSTASTNDSNDPWLYSGHYGNTFTFSGIFNFARKFNFAVKCVAE
jgi:hypothetical protein